MNYAELSDFEINKLVAEALGLDGEIYVDCVNPAVNALKCSQRKDYCNNQTDAWPIILEHEISVIFDMGSIMASRSVAFDGPFCSTEGDVFDLNPLRAAMVVFLMMNEGK